MGNDTKRDDGDPNLAKAIARGCKVLKPKRTRLTCSVCGAADVALYRHTSLLALYCAKHEPTG
jgi:hypothetical protein